MDGCSAREEEMSLVCNLIVGDHVIGVRPSQPIVSVSVSFV